MYLEIKDMKKSFGSGESYNQVLKGITTNIEQGQMCVIQGSSGSGKSTMLNCIGGLDTMDSGSVKVDGNEISGLNADELSEYRRAGAPSNPLEITTSVANTFNIRKTPFLQGLPAIKNIFISTCFRR